MKYVWNLSFNGNVEASGTLTGDPMIALLVNREMGLFIPATVQSKDIPSGWEVGELVTQTKGAKRILRATVIARVGGQRYWLYPDHGTRYFDYSSWSGWTVVVEADKPASESCFATQLTRCGWKFDKEDVLEDIEGEPLYLMISRYRDENLMTRCVAT